MTDPIGPSIRFRPKLSSRGARALVLDLAKYGNQPTLPAMWDWSETKIRHFLAANGPDVDRLADECREWPTYVTGLENIIGPTWSVTGSATVQMIDRETKDPVSELVQGPGQIVTSSYWGSFDAAWKALRRAVAESSYPDLLTAITHGEAAVEAFVEERVTDWNRKNPGAELLSTQGNAVRFEDRLRKWIPIMAGGAALDLSTRTWTDFCVLRELRNDRSAHIKVVGHGMSLADLAKHVNLFRTGIAGLLLQLHVLFKTRVPSSIVRASHAPDVEVLE